MFTKLKKTKLKYISTVYVFRDMFDTTARFWEAKHAGGPFSDRDYEDKLQRVMARGVDITVALQSLARYVSKVYSWLVVVQYVSYKSKNGNVKTFCLAPNSTIFNWIRSRRWTLC